MAETNRSIQGKLLLIVLLPIILLSTIITVVGVVLFSGFYTQSVRDELVSTTNMMFDCLDLAVRGDYAYGHGMLLKGDLNITDSTMLFRLKEKSQIDTTIFWEDVRVLTTVEDEQGISAVGTKADEEVADTVLRQGQSYFPDKLRISGIDYIGYYAPIVNSDHEIVGMMFAGKQKNLVQTKIAQVVLVFVVFSVIIIMISIFITRKFSSRIISDIHLINQYLKTVSEGDLRGEMDERIQSRDDEIGTIGYYAALMRGKLQKLVEMDPLTDLYNRRMCHSFLKEIVENGEDYCVVMGDIDFFKRINDHCGHDAGDYVLVEIANLLKQSVKDVGYASRWGGEEFLLVYKLGYESTKEKAGQLRTSIKEHNFVYGNESIAVTMTFGMARGNLEVSYEKVITEADEKLYVGKNNGRDQVVF